MKSSFAQPAAAATTTTSTSVICLQPAATTTTTTTTESINPFFNSPHMVGQDFSFVVCATRRSNVIQLIIKTM